MATRWTRLASAISIGIAFLAPASEVSAKCCCAEETALAVLAASKAKITAAMVAVEAMIIAQLKMDAHDIINAVEAMNGRVAASVEGMSSAITTALTDAMNRQAHLERLREAERQYAPAVTNHCNEQGAAETRSRQIEETLRPPVENAARNSGGSSGGGSSGGGSSGGGSSGGGSSGGGSSGGGSSGGGSGGARVDLYENWLDERVIMPTAVSMGRYTVTRPSEAARAAGVTALWDGPSEVRREVANRLVDFQPAVGAVGSDASARFLMAAMDERRLKLDSVAELLRWLVARLESDGVYNKVREAIMDRTILAEEWSAQLAAANDVSVLREIAEQLALRNLIKRERLELAMRRAAVLATYAADQLNRHIGQELDTLRVQGGAQ